MFFRLLSICLITVTLVSCNGIEKTNPTGDKNTHKGKQANKVLSNVLKTRKLRAATNYGSLSYFVYRGEPMGYQYELLTSLCTYLNVELELVIEKDLSRSIKMLNDRDIDIIAMGLTMTNTRKKELLFTQPILISRQVLVQRKPDGWKKMVTADEIESHMLRSTLDLAGKTIYVEAGTVFEQQLKNLADEIAGDIEVVSDGRETEELIAAVAAGEIDFSVADEHVAIVNARYYTDLDVTTFISFPQKIGWAVKKNQYALADTINDWIDQFNNGLVSRLIYNKYFKNIRSRRIANSSFNSYSGSSLSPYDSLIKQGANQIGWDWRLLASLIYQESEFKPEVRSWVGAFGLMQLMPAVMEIYGVDSTSSPEVQIMAGVMYLQSIEKQLPPSITDSLQRDLFTMASYNSGLGHVLDARRLAKKNGYNPDIWTDNTDLFVLKLSDAHFYNDPVVYYGYLRGEETYAFVREIIDRYGHYVNLINHESTINK